MKIELDLHKCSKEMFNAFNKHLNKYDISVGEILEEFIFAMDRSGRLCDPTQDEACLAKEFFNRAILDVHLISYEEFHDFKFKGEIFNTEYQKELTEFMKKINQEELHESENNTILDGKGNHHG